MYLLCAEEPCSSRLATGKKRSGEKEEEGWERGAVPACGEGRLVFLRRAQVPGLWIFTRAVRLHRNLPGAWVAALGTETSRKILPMLPASNVVLPLRGSIKPHFTITAVVSSVLMGLRHWVVNQGDAQAKKAA